jgi:hypothetical protein
VSYRNPKYNISDVCSDKQNNQHDEIASVKSEATISVVTKNVGENTSGSSVITSTQLPSREGHLLNILLQAMTNTVTRELKTQQLSKVSTNVANDVTEAIALDDPDLITPSFRMIIVINIIPSAFIFLTAVVLLILLLRQRRKHKRRHIPSSLTVSQYTNEDCENDDLNSYEDAGNDPSNWTSLLGPIRDSAL